jgi:hypothetical protein
VNIAATGRARPRTQADAPSHHALDHERRSRVAARLDLRKHRADWRDQPGHIIDVALLVLSDGHPRTGDEIWAEGRRRHFLATTAKKDVYVALIAYIERHSGQGRWSVIVQDVDRRFRLNHPLDDWPDPKRALPSRKPVVNFEALRDALHKTQRGDDAAAYEIAVLNAFQALGFVVQHIGGNGAPDGVLDAPLGPLGYRVMMECKRAKVQWVLMPDAAEAARYREPFGAKYSIMVGPAFENGTNLRDELLAHRVSCWESDDVVLCLERAYDVVEMEALFAPGFVRQHIDDVLWEREHGLPKRTAVVCDLLHESAPRIQMPTGANAAEVPRLDVNAALLLVDGALTALGAHVPCTHADIEAAFRHLTDPLVGEAVYADPARTAIVLRRLT